MNQTEMKRKNHPQYLCKEILHKTIDKKTKIQKKSKERKNFSIVYCIPP